MLRLIPNFSDTHLANGSLLPASLDKLCLINDIVGYSYVSAAATCSRNTSRRRTMKSRAAAALKNALLSRRTPSSGRAEASSAARRCITAARCAMSTVRGISLRRRRSEMSPSRGKKNRPHDAREHSPQPPARLASLLPAGAAAAWLDPYIAAARASTRALRCAAHCCFSTCRPRGRYRAGMAGCRTWGLGVPSYFMPPTCAGPLGAGSAAPAQPFNRSLIEPF